jgi:hypothetical protein
MSGFPDFWADLFSEAELIAWHGGDAITNGSTAFDAGERRRGEAAVRWVAAARPDDVSGADGAGEDEARQGGDDRGYSEHGHHLTDLLVPAPSLNRRSRRSLRTDR